MTVKAFAEKYHLSEKTVLGYCRHGKIVGAQKAKKGWIIPDDSIKPLKDKQVRLMLISILLFKNTGMNNPDFTLGGCSEADIPSIFKYLSDRKLILGYNINDGNKIPYNSYVSNEGISFLFNNSRQEDFLKTISKYASSLTEVLLIAMRIIQAQGQ